MLPSRQIRAEARALARQAQVSSRSMTALLMGVLLGMNLLLALLPENLSGSVAGIFLQVLVFLVSVILQDGFLLYCIAVHRGQLAEYATLFDGFSFVGKLLALHIFLFAMIYFGSILFLVPGLLLFYAFRFAVYDLCEDPEKGVLDVLRLSLRQTAGRRMALLRTELPFLPFFLLGRLPYLFFNSCFLLGYDVPLSTLAMTLISGLWLGLVSLLWLPQHKLCILSCLALCREDTGEQPPALPPDSDPQ